MFDDDRYPVSPWIVWLVLATLFALGICAAAFTVASLVS